jgi:NAD(P)-dependent dehydrogenase (short-subunit alcohol dehydrogenase family)
VKSVSALSSIRGPSARDFAGDPAIVASPGDIADPATAERIAEAAIERFGRMDTLVNNAGLFMSKPFVGYTEADFATMITANLAGFLHITQRAVSRRRCQIGGGLGFVAVCDA